MIVCDEYLALAALSNNLPHDIAEERIATTPAAWLRLLRAFHNLDYPLQTSRGQLSQLLSQLSPDSLAELATPDPQRLTLLDPRPFLSASARLTLVYRLSYMAAEMAAASVHHRAPLYFSRERNVPPGLYHLLPDESLPDIRIISPA